MVKRFKLALVLAYTWSAGIALAHNGQVPDEKEQQVDCRTLFNFTFPKILDFMTSIDCNQFISNNEDWTWRYPNSYFDRPFISAFSPRTRKAETGTRFFRRISAYEADEAERQEAYETIFKNLRNFPDKHPPKRMIRMDTVNDIKDETQIYFGFNSEDSGWAVVCAPDCAPEYFFLIEKR
jgi:hypothetical protein